MSGRPIEVRAKCPRCETKFTAEVGSDGFFICPGCGARLRHRRPSPTLRPQVTAGLKAAVAEASASRERSLEDQPPEDTPQAESTERAEPAQPSEAAPGPEPTPEPPIPAEDRAPPEPDVRALDGEQEPSSESQPEPQPTSEPEASMGPAPIDPFAADGQLGKGSSASLEELMLALYETQKQILDILHTHLVAAPHEAAQSASLTESGDQDVTALPPAPTRAERRKNVLLIDDDAQSLRAARVALEQAQIPVRCVGDGEAALAAIAAEKPDVIALEGEMGGALTGRDLVDRVMASMEWIDIPIVLYTRASLESQEEARTTYSADAYVLKGPQGPMALVSQVITAFRKRETP